MDKVRIKIENVIIGSDFDRKLKSFLDDLEIGQLTINYFDEKIQDESGVFSVKKSDFCNYTVSLI